ncbi:MAG: FAD-dependent oxidoreductase [Caldisericia bacterium]|nr:FAD-dependent oxidoreductase [Caldisericia bacterium]
MKKITVVIGGGPAGISAAVYLKRFSRDVTMVEQNMMLGGQVIIPHKIENYLGFPEGIGGFDLASMLQKQVTDLNIPLVYQTCKSITKNKEGFSVLLENNEVLTADFVIFAVGTKDRLLSIPGEAEFMGKGLSTCATCDAPFFKNKTIAVIGGGDTSLTETMYLSTYASKIHLFHRRDSFRGFSSLAEKIKNNPKIQIHYSCIPVAIKGNEVVNTFAYRDLKTDKEHTLTVDGIFKFTGYIPDASLCEGLVDLDSQDFILTNSQKETRTSGLYAVGDVSSKELRQIITAMNDGAVAANHIHHTIITGS